MNNGWRLMGFMWLPEMPLRAMFALLNASSIECLARKDIMIEFKLQDQTPRCLASRGNQIIWRPRWLNSINSNMRSLLPYLQEKGIIFNPFHNRPVDPNIDSGIICNCWSEEFWHFCFALIMMTFRPRSVSSLSSSFKNNLLFWTLKVLEIATTMRLASNTTLQLFCPKCNFTHASKWLPVDHPSGKQPG